MPRWQVPCRQSQRFHWAYSWSSACSHARLLSLPSCSLVAFGSRNGAQPGFGSCWFRCLHRSGLHLDEQVVHGASTLNYRAAIPLHRGGEQSFVRVSVIIPTHNEAQAIGRVLADLPSDLVTEV